MNVSILNEYLIPKLSIFRYTNRVKAKVTTLDDPMLGSLWPRNTMTFATFHVNTQRFTLAISRVATLANVWRSGNFFFANFSVGQIFFFCFLFLYFCLFVLPFFDILSFFISSPRDACRRVGVCAGF